MSTPAPHYARPARLLLLLALLLSLASPVLAQTEVSGPGVIEILVNNATTGETPDVLPLFLWIIDGENLVGSRTTETSGGMARFEDLPTDANWAYVVQAEYNNAPFSSDLVQFSANETVLRLPLNVYDGGASSADISISRGHWVVSIESPHSIDIGELYALTNSSDRVFMGEDETGSHVLTFHLPPNATNISFEDGALGERYVQVGDIIYDTLPMPPGQRQIFFRYSLPVEDERVVLAHPVAYAVTTLNLLVPDLGMQVEAPGWTQGESRQTPDAAYLNFTLANLAADSTPQATFSNLNAAIFTALTGNTTTADASVPRQVVDAEATPGISGQPFLPFLLALLALAALGGGMFFSLRHRRAQIAAAPRRRQQLQQALVEEMAELDNAYEAGELNAAAYETERRLLKTRLATLMTGQHA